MSSKSSSAQNGQTPPGFWPSLLPYGGPTIAASVAIVPAFRDLVAKSAQQKGKPHPHMTVWTGMKGGCKAAPTIGVIIGTKVVVQNSIEAKLIGDSKEGGVPSLLVTSAVVGLGSAPLLAIFNGLTMGEGMQETLRKFSKKQWCVIGMRETAFVAGLCGADRLADMMKQMFGDNKVVEYLAAFTSGAVGSVVGHPADTALTRWQSGMTVNSFRQSMWGAARRARGVGIFSVVYKLVNEILNSTVENSK